MIKSIVLFVSIFVLFSCDTNNLSDLIIENKKQLEKEALEISETSGDILLEKKEKPVNVLPIENINSLEESTILESESDENFEIKYDVNFYSQFPLTGAGKYDEPYQNFCEEASLLNAYYYFQKIRPTKEEYIIDLNKLKEIEDKLFGENGYRDTSVRDSLLTLLFFQNMEFFQEYLDLINNKEFEKLNEFLQKVINENKNKGGVFGRIETFPLYDSLSQETKEDYYLKLRQNIYSKILNSLENGNLVIVPVYGKGLKNPSFTDGGPIYHNFLISGIKGKNQNEGFFITQEVGTTYGANHEYNKNIVLENIYDFEKGLYPEKFTEGIPRILILFK